MGNNEKATFRDCLKITKNILLTGDSQTEFKLSKDENDANTVLQNSIKKQKLYLFTIVGIIVILFMISMMSFLLGVKHFAFVEMILRVIGGACVLIIGWKYTRLVKNNYKQYDEDVVEKAVHSILPDAKIDPAGRINVDKLYNMGVIPDFSSASGSYLISYSRNGGTNYFSNLSLDYTNDVYGQGKVNTVFTGQAYVLYLSNCLKGKIRLVASKNKKTLSLLHRTDKNEKQVMTGNSIFDDTFTVYATDDSIVSYALNNEVMNKLLKLKQRYGAFALSMCQNEVVVAFNTGVVYFAMPHNYQSIEQISTETSKSEIQNILNVVKDIENSIIVKY